MNFANWLKKRRNALQAHWYGKLGQYTEPEKWIFVVGCYNSGTTLLHNVLASHPAIASLPREGQFCTDQLLVPSEVGLTRCWALQPQMFQLDAKDNKKTNVQRIQRQWSSMMQPTGCSAYLEKSIPNAARIPWLDKNFHNAYFIGIVRNGFAVTEGIMRKAGRSSEQASKQWSISNEIMLRDLQATARNYLTTYEAFTADPEKTIRHIFKFLGLPVITSDTKEKTWNIHGLKSEIRNMNPASINRLSSKDKEIVMQVGNNLLTRFDYLNS